MDPLCLARYGMMTAASRLTASANCVAEAVEPRKARRKTSGRTAPVGGKATSAALTR
jgi:hypothetical protein